MSDPRSTYPQAKAWTFLLDTPDTTSSSAAVGRAPSAVATGAGRPCLVAAGETVSRHEKKSSLGGNCGGSDPAAGSGVANGGNGTEAGEMGAMCSKSTNVANKENMGDLEEVMMFPNGDSDSSRSVSVNADCCEGNDKGMRDSSETLETPDGDDAAAGAADCCKSDLPDEGAMLASMLESTTPISPIDLEEHLVRGSAASPVADRIIATGSGGISSNDMRPEDRWAWVTDNLKMLPTGANAVEIDQLKQVSERGAGLFVCNWHYSLPCSIHILDVHNGSNIICVQFPGEGNIATSFTHLECDINCSTLHGASIDARSCLHSEHLGHEEAAL